MKRYWCVVKDDFGNHVSVHENSVKETWYEAYRLARSTKRIHQGRVIFRIYDDELDEYTYPRIILTTEGKLYINRK